MRTAIFTIAFLVGLSTSFLFTPRDPSSPAVVGFPIEREIVPLSEDIISRRALDETSKVRRRGARVKNQSITNSITHYTSKVYVGAKNPQEVTLQIDTGSAEFWMVEASAKLCKDSHCGSGTFSAKKSKSFRPIKGSSASFSYVDGTDVTGFFGTDTINVGGISLPNFKFALATQTTDDLGVIGLGYALTQKLHIQSMPTYPTLPEALMTAGKINLNAYSLWLNRVTASTGLVLYGGVDSDKFLGKLITLPVAPAERVDPQLGPIPELLVHLNSVSFEGAQSSSTTVLLDCGFDISILPVDIVNTIYTTLKAKIDRLNNWAWVDCGLRNSDRTIDFEFGHESERVVVQVPLSQMVFERDDGEPLPKSAQGQNLCCLALYPVDDELDHGILGASFLRSAYVVFDLSNNQISIAQASFSGGSNIVEIPREGVTALTF